MTGVARMGGRKDLWRVTVQPDTEAAVLRTALTNYLGTTLYLVE